jgi:hypothetical protein
MGARRFVSSVLAWLWLAVGCGLLWGASAQALTVHEFAGSFGSEGSASGQFEEPDWIAVNDATHDVYVVDNGNDRVEEFNSTGSVELDEFNGSAAPTGKFLNESLEPVPGDIAIDNSGDPLTDPSAGDVYVVDSGHHVVDKFSASGVYEGQLTGTPGGAFGHLSGVAVDPSGVVWVAQENGEIYNFSDAATNEYLSVRGTNSTPGPGLGVDSEDNIYLGSTTSIEKYSSSGEPLVRPLGGQIEVEEEEYIDGAPKEGTTGFAVDASGNPTGGEVYIARYNTLASKPKPSEGKVTALSLGGAVIEHFGSGYLASGGPIAVDESNGTVYVSDRTADRVVIFDAFVAPSVSIEAVSEAQFKSLTLNGTVTPEGIPVTTCQFEYGTSTSYGHTVECEPSASSLGSGSSPVAVSAHLTGIVPGVLYHYRLVAANGNQKLSLSPDGQFSTGPTLENVSVDDVASTSATLQAQIGPNGKDTHYYFQYGTTASYGQEAPAPPGDDLGSANAAQTVSLHVQELQEGTLYHYRVVAIQEGEVFYAPDHTFTTQAASNGLSLPDGRKWELVSPPDKKGAVIEPFEEAGATQAANDGSGIAYIADGPHIGEDPQGRSVSSEILSRRGPGGWSSVDIDMPRRNVNEGETTYSLISGRLGGYGLFSSDLSLAVGEPTGTATPPLSPEATERTLYLRNNTSNLFLPLVTPANVPPGTKFGGEESILHAGNLDMRFVTATPDLAHVVFESPLVLAPPAVTAPSGACEEDACGAQNLYEWGAGHLQLVNILPNGEATHSSVFSGAFLAGEGNYETGLAARPVSADGRWVAWTLENPYSHESGSDAYGGLYVRDMIGEKTFEVGGADARYQTMSIDGSRIFYLENGDLHEFSTVTDTQIDLTASRGGEVAGVQESVSDVSEDGSYVYFVATGVLAPGGVSGGDNLYLLHEGNGKWTTTYIATLSNEDEKDWFAQGGTGGGPELARVSSRVSPNGRYLAFMSNVSLTGYDNRDAISGQPDEEVYLYDGAANRLVCASCDPTGARPVGVFDDGQLLTDKGKAWQDHWLAGSIPGWDSRVGEQAVYQPRYLSDGGRLFFDSADALVAQDTNGSEDVYEYEPPESSTTPASDDCTTASASFSASSDGCVSLISSGASSAESTFYDASENGDDAFFITDSRLTAADYDDAYDVYDAHVCSVSSPCAAEPVSPPPCTSGDSCKAAPSPQPAIFGPAPSATFSGVGNVVEEATKSVVKHKAKPKGHRKHKAKKHRAQGRKAKRRKAKKTARARTLQTSGKDGK